MFKSGKIDMKSILHGLTLTLIVAMIVWPRHSSAAPQILGVISTSPVPLKCSGKQCQAVFSSFCLQQHRDIPKPGTRYNLLPSAEVFLIIAHKNGKYTEMEIPHNLSIKSVQNFTSVSMSLPKQFITSQGGVSAAIRIGRLVSVIPENIAGDPNALSKSELKKYTGPIRKLAEKIKNYDSLDVAIAVHINRIINQIVSDRPAEAGDSDRLWRKIIGDTPMDGSNLSLYFAAKEIAGCEATSRNSASFGAENALGLKSCLQSTREEHMNEFSRKVWLETNRGS